ncbi:tannase/feruloyl esterase family alpha/beta hydrolase [Variovorax saccharolyticus]|uniref:tannase/feruloyl esterase family alpha/beta hydrolase n=1 Tax=Variovorax saccharolyticus TaxID=3053516 RepID=UPI002578275E|nr:tannase/feruloyl esterase family alpha/beta hydrolase [Variovorax sp. J22R187]MDM0021965.1 tannase/feruloyl esterase family alpha/beta hydrolase [Variovorax sp. J22R187]
MRTSIALILVSCLAAACGGGGSSGFIPPVASNGASTTGTSSTSAPQGGSSSQVAPPAGPTTPVETLPVLAAATGATLGDCASLAGFSFANTTVTAANPIAAGTLAVAGKPVGAHCQVRGSMYSRTGPVDGQSYAIGFEMRLPVNWNGRFFYQANGGVDGSVATATGAVGGGGSLDNALNMGFAVISSDAGHQAPTPFFGIDPQARLDYGYQAVAKLTPMAKALIASGYGKGPERSYFGGCSNGGRHTMVAMSRYPDDYDGFLVGNPGFRLPLAAAANIVGAQNYNALATTPGSPGTGFTQAERTLVSQAVLARCDALDGATDGLVQDTGACQAAFDLDRDVPTCSGARDGSCLSADQKQRIGQLFAGALDGHGQKFYTSFPYDAGLGTNGWASWKFSNSLNLDSGAVGFIWQVPPETQAGFNGPSFTLTTSIDSILAKITATSVLYTESSLSFMTPPNSTDLSRLKKRGAKVMAYHGTSDPIFSSDDTQQWYDALAAANGGDASNFARFYRVPGMNHCGGGPAVDQFDMLTPLVNWVEKGQPAESVVASARGTGNAGGVNADLPAGWAVDRTRPLCAYPKVARYKGSGDVEKAESFSCR